MRRRLVLLLAGWSVWFAACFTSSEVCVPECGDRECGEDPVCYVSCGDCGANQNCSDEGFCLPATCGEPTRELCGDGEDNDCDGETDEGFPGVGSPCQDRGCPGFVVCSEDRLSELCLAPEPAGDDATCDGLDEDCDGTTDEDAIARLCPLQESICAGSTETCLNGAWSGCDYGPGYTEGTDDVCDRVDNDCDGQTDEDVEPLLEPESGPQATDGLDNNCNGLVDEPGGVMVPVPNHPGVWIDAYEASVFENPDCTGPQYGVVDDDYPPGFPADATQPTITLYACSLQGILPSGHVSWYRARWACEAQGKRLCSVGEWGNSCSQSSGIEYPYGPGFEPGTCNDPLGGSGAPEPTGSRPGCTSNARTFDMSGNLTEWNKEWENLEGFEGNAETGGGSYACILCNRSGDCNPCEPETEYWIEQEVADCEVGGIQESFPRESAWAYLGARCCLDAP